MKKTYIKPEILFEDFSLNNSITAGCERIAPYAMNECAYTVETDYGTMKVFLDDLNGVCDTFKEDGKYKGICYHVPTSADNVFAS